jgi:hypothetical protein
MMRFAIGAPWLPSPMKPQMGLTRFFVIQSVLGSGCWHRLASENSQLITKLTHLQRLEAESIHIFREVVAEMELPVMLYSIGKDRAARQAGMELIVYHNPEALEKGINPFDHGARRDEEKSRAKERIFSFRSANHRWDPKKQRPELWNLYHARKAKGESIRVFPVDESCSDTFPLRPGFSGIGRLS